MQMDEAERRAVLTLWTWQSSMNPELSREQSAPFLKEMMHWTEDYAGPLSRLKGRALAARLGDELLAIVLLRYEHDRSSWERAISGAHVMVVEATALNPAVMTSRKSPVVTAGLQQSLMQLAECHSMRIEFSRDVETRASRRREEDEDEADEDFTELRMI